MVLRQRLMLLIFIILNQPCFSQHELYYPISVNVIVLKEYYGPYDNDANTSIKERRFDIDATVRNTSMKTIYIWLMTCSWEDGFIINNNYMTFRRAGCLSNYPTLIELKPGKEEHFRTTLAISIKFDHPPPNTIFGKQIAATKLGLVITNDIYEKIGASSMDYRLSMEDKSSWRKIVWSNPLYLLK